LDRGLGSDPEEGPGVGREHVALEAVVRPPLPGRFWKAEKRLISSKVANLRSLAVITTDHNIDNKLAFELFEMVGLNQCRQKNFFAQVEGTRQLKERF
jgi:hypothetical protein